MKNFKIISALFLLALTALTSCVVPTHPSKPVGQISLKAQSVGSSQSSNLSFQGDILSSSRSVVARAVGNGNSFDLGDIPSTQSFLFLVQNTGAGSVSDINFKVSAGPQSGGDFLAVASSGNFGSLAPNSAADQLLVVTILHGSTANGLQQGPPSPQGANQITLDIKYDDGNGIQTQPVTMDYSIQSWALEISIDDTLDPGSHPTVALGPANYTAKLPEFSNDFFMTVPTRPFYGIWEFATPSKVVDNTHNVQISLHNTGNVPITLFGHIEYGKEVATGVNYRFPFSWTIPTGGTITGNQFDALWVAAMSGTSEGNSLADTASPLAPGDVPTSYWDSILNYQNYNNGPGFATSEIFIKTQMGAIPSVENVYTSNGKENGGYYAITFGR